LSHKSDCWVAGDSFKRDRRRMSSIIRLDIRLGNLSSGDTLRGVLRGISVDGRGVFTNGDDNTRPERSLTTYAGQCRDGYACGLGVTTASFYTHEYKEYAEHGPDGKYDGRRLQLGGSYEVGNESWRYTGYYLYERGKEKEYALVFDSGPLSCEYNGSTDCARDDLRVLELIAQVAPVEVRPAQPQNATRLSLSPKQSSNGSDCSFCSRRRRRPPLPPRCTPTPHAVAGGCARQPNSSHTAKHVHTVTHTRALWSHGRHPLAP
jgi:hypothetical protein